MSEAAVQVLVTASKDTAGLSAAAIQRYVQLQAYPSCLLPLLSSVITACTQPDSTAEQKAGAKRVLLSVLGDLEEVWADAALRNTLLKLPLRAMELLLSYDEIKVASEDTVLYTAQAYVSNTPDAQRSQAKQQLAALIRCPQLSPYWLSVSAGCDDTANLLLSEYQPQLRKLQTVISISKPGYVPSAAELQEFLSGAPPAWTLPRRSIKAVSSVQLVWLVDVGEIRAAAESCGNKHTLQLLRSTDVSPPLGGISFGLQLECSWDAKGVKLGVYAKSRSLPWGAFLKFSFTVSAGGVNKKLATLCQTATVVLALSRAPCVYFAVTVCTVRVVTRDVLGLNCHSLCYECRGLVQQADCWVVGRAPVGIV